MHTDKQNIHCYQYKMKENNTYIYLNFCYKKVTWLLYVIESTALKISITGNSKLLVMQMRYYSISSILNN